MREQELWFVGVLNSIFSRAIYSKPRTSAKNFDSMLTFKDMCTIVLRLLKDSDSASVLECETADFSHAEIQKIFSDKAQELADCLGLIKKPLCLKADRSCLNNRNISKICSALQNYEQEKGKLRAAQIQLSPDEEALLLEILKEGKTGSSAKCSESEKELDEFSNILNKSQAQANQSLANLKKGLFAICNETGISIDVLS